MRTMRRAERALAEPEAFAVLAKAEYGVLSTVAADGQPYGVPVNFCVLDHSIYLHSAVAGHKIDNFTADPRVSFCVVGKTRVLPEKFSTEYESAIVFGVMSEVFALEKERALAGMLQKYCQGYIAEGLEYIAAAREKTRVFKVKPATITGKARR
ncbi:MAG: pyridoxamine 5'-phosphate oxidase family protein [Deltaproteobacteria bacterium]|nr:pyridoxamine 5'-phosphate oxidase family protein [Deltaproteobacteria bacterium]